MKLFPSTIHTNLIADDGSKGGLKVPERLPTSQSLSDDVDVDDDGNEMKINKLKCYIYCLYYLNLYFISSSFSYFISTLPIQLHPTASSRQRQVEESFHSILFNRNFPPFF